MDSNPPFIGRTVKAAVLRWLRPQRVVLLKGARRTGKTELARQIQQEFDGRCDFLNAEDMDTRNLLADQSVRNYRNLFGQTDLLIIDEAPVIPDIGLMVKLIADEVKGVRILLTGSSSLTLTQSTGEPLTGRKTDLELYPFSMEELRGGWSGVELRKQLTDRILYGSYPEVVFMEHPQDRKIYLKEMLQSYIIKHVLKAKDLKESEKLRKLLQLLALQAGQEVSLQELGNTLGMSKNTVERYMELLWDAYVIFPLSGYQKNLRKEVAKSKKWYFCDTGIRNAIIGDFKPLELRPDAGALWENFVITERLRQHRMNLRDTALYFWRTYDRQEVDLIEEDEDGLRAFELKWRLPSKKVKSPMGFAKAYPEAAFEVVHSENWYEYL